MARKHTTRLTLFASLMFVACTTVPLPEQLLHTSGRCDNEGGVVEDDSSRQEGSLRGDLNGDGTQDEVHIAADPFAPSGCNSFLVAKIGLIKISAPIDPSGVPRSLDVPSLNSLAGIDEHPGHEIVVNIEMGASTQFVGVFLLHGNTIKQLEVGGEGPGPFAGEQGDLLAFGGSVGHLEAVDCTDDGHVVVSVALPKGSGADAYEVERRFFSVEDTELILDKGLTEKHTIRGLKVDDFPEFASSPFGSCD